MIRYDSYKEVMLSISDIRGRSMSTLPRGKRSWSEPNGEANRVSMDRSFLSEAPCELNNYHQC